MKAVGTAARLRQRGGLIGGARCSSGRRAREAGGWLPALPQEDASPLPLRECVCVRVCARACAWGRIVWGRGSGCHARGQGPYLIGPPQRQASWLSALGRPGPQPCWRRGDRLAAALERVGGDCEAREAARVLARSRARTIAPDLPPVSLG